MLFAVLELLDFVIIGLMILFLAGGGRVVMAQMWPAERDRLARVEDKLDLILTHLGIDYEPPTKAAWQELADDPGQKIAAIKAYREQHGTGLAEAKRAVEEYIEGRAGPA